MGGAFVFPPLYYGAIYDFVAMRKMETALKSYCVHCGGPMEYPPNLAGEKIVCPHCNHLTFLGSPKTAPPPVPATLATAPPPAAQPLYVTTQSTGKGIKAGITLSALAIVVCIVFALVNPVWWVAVGAFAMALIFFRALKWWQHE